MIMKSVYDYFGGTTHMKSFTEEMVKQELDKYEKLAANSPDNKFLNDWYHEFYNEYQVFAKLGKEEYDRRVLIQRQNENAPHVSDDKYYIKYEDDFFVNLANQKIRERKLAEMTDNFYYDPEESKRQAREKHEQKELEKINRKKLSIKKKWDKFKLMVEVTIITGSLIATGLTVGSEIKKAKHRAWVNSNADTSITYTVQEGDTLSSLSDNVFGDYEIVMTTVPIYERGNGRINVGDQIVGEAPREIAEKLVQEGKAVIMEKDEENDNGNITFVDSDSSEYTI